MASVSASFKMRTKCWFSFFNGFAKSQIWTHLQNKPLKIPYRTNHWRCYFLVSCWSTKQIVEDIVLWVYRTNHWRYCFVVTCGSTKQIIEDTVLKLWYCFAESSLMTAKSQVCVTMAAMKRILKTNVPHFADFLSLLSWTVPDLK